MKYWEKRKSAFKYAFNGIGVLFRDEAHAKIHAVVAVLVVIAGFVFRVSLSEWCLLAICIGMVFAAEAFNTAIETLANRVTKDNDPLIARTKDVAAAGVLLIVFGAIAVGLIIFTPKLIALLL